MEKSAQELDLKMEQIEIDDKSLKNYFNTKSVSWKIREKHFEIKDITINNFKFDLFDSYSYPLCFKNCIFDCEIREVEGLSLSIKQPISFLNCTFKKDVIIFNFHFHIIAMLNCVFESKCYFEFSIFNKFANFRGTTFNYVSFEGSKFNDDANFYGVKFEKAPNFSQVQFKGSLNAVNTEMLFQVQDLKNTIKEAKEKYDIESNVNKSLIYFINDFRDSFRILKNALIKDNNLLDASNFHKYELYSKEIELDSKETKTIKDKVEKWQLWFYRKLCDHHTDLVLNLKWLVYTIALYVLLLGKIPYVYPVAIFVFCVYVYMRGFKNVWLIVSSAIVFITILDTPKIILGISNLFGENLNLWQNFITTLYVIAIGLVLFSLQKTARKNSIVPN